MYVTANTIDESILEEASDSESDDMLNYKYLIDDGDDGVSDANNLSIYTLNDVSGDTFPGVRIFDSIYSEKSSSYFKVHIDGKRKCIQKHTACWLFTDDKKSLSIDLLRRVIQQTNNS